MPTPVSQPDDVALSLTLAVVGASPSPLLLLNGDFAIVAASKSFREAFDLAQIELAGLPLYGLSNSAWDIPELHRLLEATLSGAQSDDCELDLHLSQPPLRHLVIQARRLDYLDLDQTRLLVALSDVTEARADMVLKEEKARHNIVLLQEVRHRIANSLQIIASVLLQNARRTHSEETRAHLKDAHHRVMSVAALERLLSSSQEGDVDVHAYFTAICENITASMIGESGNVKLTVEGGYGFIDARLSVSLGLIITELVINALKHAFPEGRPGKVTIDYKFQGPNWIVCVSDDGVGMPLVAPDRTGLGTSIIQALAGQLKASVTTLPKLPGTMVSIEHTQIALVYEEPDIASQPFANAQTQPATPTRQNKKDRS